MSWLGTWLIEQARWVGVGPKMCRVLRLHTKAMLATIMSCIHTHAFWDRAPQTMKEECSVTIVCCTFVCVCINPHCHESK